MSALEELLSDLRAFCAGLEDKRLGQGYFYTMADIGLAAFSVFLMQSPSFLGHQRALGRRERGREPAQRLRQAEPGQPPGQPRSARLRVPHSRQSLCSRVALRARRRRRQGALLRVSAHDHGISRLPKLAIPARRHRQPEGTAALTDTARPTILFNPPDTPSRGPEITSKPKMRTAAGCYIYFL